MYDPKLSAICCEYLQVVHNKRYPLTEQPESFILQTLLGVEIGLFKPADSNPILVFSGVNSLQDSAAVSNFTYRLRQEGGVFSSIRTIYSNIHLELIRIIKAAIGEDTEIIVCGYSMGAVLASFFVYNSGLKVSDCYLFGSPRPGDENFSNSYNEKYLDITHRVTVPGDFITHLPVTGWHIGKPHLIGEHNHYEAWSNLVRNTLFDDPKFLLLTPLVLLTFALLIKLKVIENKHDLSLYSKMLKG